MLLRFIDGAAQDSEQWLDIVDQTRIVLLDSTRKKLGVQILWYGFTMNYRYHGLLGCLGSIAILAEIESQEKSKI